MSWIKNLFGLKPTEDEFAAIAKKHLQKALSTREIGYNKEQFSLFLTKADGTVESVYYLTNAFADYCQTSGFERQKLLDAYFTPREELSHSLEDVISDILPRVQLRCFYEELILHHKLEFSGKEADGDDDTESMEIPYNTIAEHFAQGLCHDQPQIVTQVTNRMCRDWQTSIADLLPRAIENLSKLTPKPFHSPTAGVYISQYSDTHDASRILLIDRIRECNLMGRPIVMIPNRNTLIISGESNPVGLAIMLNASEVALKQPRPMAAIPLVLSDSTWYPLQVRDDHPEKSRVDYWRMMAMRDIYNSQKDLLDQLYAKEQKELFVATYTGLVKKETGVATSAAAWTQDVPSLLPRADRITLVRVADKGADVLCTIPWEVAQQTLGDLMKPQGMYPERYLVEGFPADSQIESMKKHDLRGT